MARRRRSRFGRGVANLPTNVLPPDVAPGPFFPELELEDRVSRPRRAPYAAPRTAEELVYRSRLMAEQARARAPLSRFTGRFSVSYKPLRVMSMPRRTLDCVRRKSRKEALFAMRLIGFRGSSPGTRSQYTGKYYRRTASSQYRCV